MNDTDISYYRSLDVLERLEKERKKMKIGPSMFSRMLGKCDAYWSIKYSEVHFFKISKILEFSKKINVNIEFLIYGTNYGPYREITIDMKKLAQYTSRKKFHLNPSLKSIISNIRHGKQSDIGINTFFQIEEIINKNLLKIISND